MIDMYGRLVHKIPQKKYTIMYGRFLESGNMLMGTIKPSNATLDPGNLTFAGGGWMQEVDWNGNVVWEYDAFQTDPNGIVFRQTHDFKRIWNKKLNAWTTLLNVDQVLPQQLALDLGASQCQAKGWSPGAIYEVDMSGNIVWIWTFADHTCSTLAVASSRGLHVTNTIDAPGRLNINLNNTQSVGFPGTDWNHINSIDYSDELGQIVMNSRNHNEFYVIDHDKTFVSTTLAANVAAGHLRPAISSTASARR